MLIYITIEYKLSSQFVVFSLNSFEANNDSTNIFTMNYLNMTLITRLLISMKFERLVS